MKTETKLQTKEVIMKYLIIFMLMLPITVHAAGVQYYSYPDATTVPDNGRILMYDPATGSKNITGATIRTTPSDTPLTSQPISGTNPYKRVAEFKDSTGKITSYITANGTLVLGTNVALAVTSVYPANGATGVSTSAIPQVGTNINFWATISNLYVVGSSTAPESADGSYSAFTNLWNIPATLAANTTYTIRFLKNSIIQTTGETTSSCGTVMTDVSGVCQSTFTTAP